MTWGDRAKVAKLIRELDGTLDRYGRGASVQELTIAITPIVGEVIGNIQDATLRQAIRDQFVRAVDLYIKGRVDQIAADTKLPGLGGEGGGTADAPAGAGGGHAPGLGGDAPAPAYAGPAPRKLPLLRGRPGGSQDGAGGR